MKTNLIFFALILIGSTLFYLPVILVEDPIGQGYVILFNRVLNLVFIVVCIEVVNKKVQGKPLYSFIMIIMIVITVYAPTIVDSVYNNWNKNKQYEQRLTAEDIKTKWFSYSTDYPAGYYVPLKEIIIEKENGQVHVNMVYDEQNAIRLKIKDGRSDFQSDLQTITWSSALNMSPY